MHVSQEDFDRACEQVVSIVTEHRGSGGDDGLDGALSRRLGLDPSSAIRLADFIAGDIPPGLAFLAGVLVGVQLEQGAEAVA